MYYFLLVGFMHTSRVARKLADGKQFYGMTTLGEKGQVVVPAEARTAMGLVRGDKLLVFGIGRDALAFSKIAGVEKLAARLAKRLKTIREIVEKSRRK